MYAIDNPNGPYQESSFFDNLSIGQHNIYVKDVLNDCGIVENEIFVLGYPKFFTPNNDTFNDTWQIKGVNPDFSRLTKIEIYNRYGKLLKILKSSDEFWDGTFNGDSQPADDYWFVATLQNGRTIKGHFSLRL